jgi:2-iminobutanoate/2-iminopropanoate deaminase
MPREPLATPGIKPAGPYSPAVIASGRLLFCSSQGPVDHATGERIESSIQDATRQVLTNIRTIVEHGGGSLANAVKTTVFLRDMADFAGMNEVYQEFFTPPYGARTTVQSSMNYRVAIDVIVALD